MYEEEAYEPTVDERIDFLRRVKKANDQDLEDVLNRPGRYSLANWQMEIVRDQQRRRKQERLERAAERLAETISRHGMDEEQQERLKEQVQNNLREKWLREKAEREHEEILNKINQTTQTKTKKEKITMAATKTTEPATETATPKIDTKAIIGFKVAELMTKAMDKGEGLPLTKMTIMQSIADGKGLNVNEIVKAKYTENFMKELDANKDIPLGKLIAFQTLQENGVMDINAMAQAKFVEKLFNDLDEPTEQKK